MKYKIIWSTQAKSELKNIFSYIQKDSKQRATEFGERIYSMVNQLVLFPKLGRISPELIHVKPRPREIIVENYRAIYRIYSKRIEIVTLHHVKQDFQNLNID